MLGCAASASGRSISIQNTEFGSDAWKLGQLQLIRWVTFLNTEFGPAVWQLAVMRSSQLTGFRLGSKARSGERNSTGNLIGLMRSGLRRRSRPRIRTGPACCRCPSFEPRWSVSETIRLRNLVGVSLVAQGFLLPSADIMHLSVARQIEGTAMLQHTSNELQASENSFSAG